MKKRIITLLLCAVLLFSISGCSRMQTETKPHLGFSNGVLFEDEEEVIMEADALPYESLTWDDYRGSLHYDLLSDEEKTVYKALEYALEKGYTNVLVDAELAQDGDVLEKALDALALDSPMLEQNFRCEIGTFTTYYPTMLFGLIEMQTAFSGNYITVQNFRADQLEKKQQALVEAEKIVSGLSGELNQKEKAEALFTYMCENTTYEAYSVSALDVIPAYLYDGLITGKTQCDGVSNSLSLLLNLAGVECVEKVYPGEGEEIGHTWNFFQLDGQWYNADVTGGQAGDAGQIDYFFGFPDVLQKYMQENVVAYPVSEKGLNAQVDAFVKDSVDLDAALEDAYRSHDKHWALIVVDKITEKQIRSAAQNLANAIEGEVYYMRSELPEGKTALWFYDLKYFE